MDKILVFDAERCNGCRICELVCSMSINHEYNPKESYVKLIQNREMDVNIIAVDTRCNYCGECVEACLPKALSFVGLEEAVVLRKKNRIGCFPAPLLRRV